MNRKALLTVFLLATFLSGLVPAPQPVAAWMGCDQAMFLADVTIPDGTNFYAGTAFTKTWRLQNTGSCTWDSGYTLVFSDGSQMGAPYTMVLPYSVPPGYSVDLTVPMVAPNSAGVYRGNWLLRNSNGYNFGIGAYGANPFWVEIVVIGSSLPPTPVPPVYYPTPIPPAPSGTCDRVTFIDDVNVPDGTVFAPNTAFTKTWRIKNTGTCTWTTNYSLYFVSGDQMGGPASMNLISTVSPNTSFDVSFNLIAPSVPGHYRGYWQLRNEYGQPVGIGLAGAKPWWVDILVSGWPAPAPTAPPYYPAPGPIVYGGGYDFTTMPASWSTGAGTVYFNGADPSNTGIAKLLTSVKMEDDLVFTQNSLLMVPQNVSNGYIRGVYNIPYVVQYGDHFRAMSVGCQHPYTTCNVNLWLDYQVGYGAPIRLLDWNEAYDTPHGITREVDIDLSSLAGQTVTFIFTVEANGSGYGDRAVWVYPRIVR